MRADVHVGVWQGGRAADGSAEDAALPARSALPAAWDPPAAHSRGVCRTRARSAHSVPQHIPVNLSCIMSVEGQEVVVLLCPQIQASC